MNNLEMIRSIQEDVPRLLCKYYAILYEELEHPWVLVSIGVLETNSPTDTEDRLY